jgi:hypothetical protein
MRRRRPARGVLVRSTQPGDNGDEERKRKDETHAAPKMQRDGAIFLPAAFSIEVATALRHHHRWTKKAEEETSTCFYGKRCRL